MKKLLTFTIVFILLVSFASADAFANIGMQGLSFANPELAEAINLYVCVSGGLVTCLEGKIKGRIQGEVMTSIAEAFPEVIEVMNTYNQVQGLIDLGAEITEELSVDEEGQLTEGIISFEGTEANIGKELGFEEDDVLVENVEVEFNQKEGFNQINFQKDGILWIKQNGRQTNFDNIQEQTKDRNAFVKLDNKGEIIETDFTTGEKRRKYTIGNDFIEVPPNSRVLFKDGKVDIIIPTLEEGETDFNLPSIINLENPNNIIQIKGSNIRLLGVEGSPILNKGVINIRNGQMYIAKSEEVIIDSISISNGFYSENDINLYFDGLEHQEGGTYISMNSNEGKLIAKVEDISRNRILIEFNEGNMFANIEKNDNLKLDLNIGSSLSLQPGELIPRLSIVSKNTERISNGAEIISSYFGEKVLIETRMLRPGSSPMEIIITNEDGDSLLGTKENPQKFIMSNYNELGTVPLNFFGEIEVTKGFSRFMASNSPLTISREPLIYLKKKGISIVGGKDSDFEGLDPREFLSEEEIKRVEVLISFIPEGILKTEEIVIYPQDYYQTKYGYSEGFVDLEEEEARIHLPKNTLARTSGIPSGDEGTLYHENTHTWHKSSMRNSKWEKSWLKLDHSYNKEMGNVNFIKWKDGSKEPRYGKAKPYGENDLFEDVATIPINVISNPQQYSQLIDPESFFYEYKMGRKYETGIMNSKMSQEWSDIYLGKLGLSLAGGTITLSQYTKVFEEFSEEKKKEFKKRISEILKRIEYF